MTEKTKLKPCPFCGGKAYFLHGRKNECITCEECGHRFYSLEIGEDAQKELWKQWNGRPIEDDLNEQIGRLKKYSAALEDEIKALRGALADCCCEYKNDGIPRCYARRDDPNGHCAAAKQGCLIYKVLKGDKK